MPGRERGAIVCQEGTPGNHRRGRAGLTIEVIEQGLLEQGVHERAHAVCL